jgi:hypothetical protein
VIAVSANCHLPVNAPVVVKTTAALEQVIYRFDDFDIL